jgi:hypothetical protein
MKKFLYVLVVGVLVSLLAGCGGGGYRVKNQISYS